MPSKQKQSRGIQKQIQLMSIGKKKEVHCLLPSPSLYCQYQSELFYIRCGLQTPKSVLLCFTLIVWDFPLSTVLHTKWMQVLPKTSLDLEVKGIKKLCNSHRIWTVRHWKIWMWTYKVAAETGFQKCEAILLLLGLSFRSNTGKATISEQCYCREMEEGINGRTASQASYNVEKSKNTTRQV